MPEGPEVSRMADEVRQVYLNKICNKIEIKSGKYTRHGLPDNFQKFQKSLPLTLSEVNVHGKFVWFTWEKNNEFTWNTWVQFGMTGYFCSSEYEKSSIPHIRKPEEAQNCEKHGHIWFYFDNMAPLVFSDQRNFGLLRWVDNPEVTKKYVDDLGPDPLTQDLTKTWWKNELEGRTKGINISLLLLDQSFVAGIGNYLRSEILWKAGIHPERELGSLNETELNKLRETLEEVPRQKFKEEQKTGNLEFWVYKRKKGDAEGNPVQQLKIRDRTVWFAPNKQI
jgi:DNA-formamidopyrimidine glycosylase